MIKYVIGFLALVSVTLAGIVALKSIENNNLKNHINTLQLTVESYERSQIVQEELVELNRQLEENLKEVEEEIDNAPDSETFLSDELSGSLERLRDSGTR